MRDVLLNLPEPTADKVRATRMAAGLTQRRCAELAGLGDAMRWSDYERGRATIALDRWALFLLSIDRHPRLRVITRRASPPLGA